VGDPKAEPTDDVLEECRRNLTCEIDGLMETLRGKEAS
jgi:hypothetical protein